eukprot:TRINITY_DN24187_c0_g1_i10.p2 TRINITY_DN24187_c0_g1~~TRINITY_DN24187_c0_g1_i10.p2  ORF type:complete len:120 (+),score=10.03 TRINITY_DN24187_c0_g1_i10:844-1203(+)
MRFVFYDFSGEMTFFTTGRVFLLVTCLVNAVESYRLDPKTCTEEIETCTATGLSNQHGSFPLLTLELSSVEQLLFHLVDSLNHLIRPDAFWQPDLPLKAREINQSHQALVLIQPPFSLK